jgi:hypothetical protein
VSAASVVAGTVPLTIQKYPGSWVLWIAAGIIGLGLAVLIEGMTLGGLIRIRLASASIRIADNVIEDERGRIEWVNLSKQQCKIHERELKRKRAYTTKRDRRMRTWSVPIVLVGSFASAVAGGMFYHVALAGLGTWESIGVATLFPLVVTCTFISSELFKDIQEDAIKEGYTGGGLAGAAMHEEMDRLALQSVFNGIQDHFSHPDAQQSLKEAALRLVNGKIAVIGLPQNCTVMEVTEEASGAMIAQVSVQPKVQEFVQETEDNLVQEEVQTEESNLIDFSARVCARHSEGESANASEDLSASDLCTDQVAKVQRTSSVKVQTGKAGAERANRLLKSHPNITAKNLAAKANISESYAGKLKAQFGKEVTG